MALRAIHVCRLWITMNKPQYWALAKVMGIAYDGRAGLSQGLVGCEERVKSAQIYSITKY